MDRLLEAGLSDAPLLITQTLHDTQGQVARCVFVRACRCGGADGVDLMCFISTLLLCTTHRQPLLQHLCRYGTLSRDALQASLQHPHNIHRQSLLQRLRSCCVVTVPVLVHLSVTYTSMHHTHTHKHTHTHTYTHIHTPQHTHIIHIHTHTHNIHRQSLLQRLRSYRGNDQSSILPTVLVRKYIAYAREFCTPVRAGHTSRGEGESKSNFLCRLLEYSL